MTYANLSASTAILAMAQGDITAETYSNALIEKALSYKNLNTFINFDHDFLRMAAREADKKRKAGNKLGPLHGLPIAVKDNIEVAELNTTAATPALFRNKSKRNATVVQALLDKGALIMGKTNMHELAYGLTSDNPYTGPVRNPYNHDLIAGGSSGGSAAALAAFIAPGALGSDTGGSIRQPAAMCGIVGLRPSTGRYSGNGVIPVSLTRDTIGPMARNVADLIMLDDNITGNKNTITSTCLKGVRIALPYSHFFDDVDWEVALVIEEALKRFKDFGIEIVEADLKGAETCKSDIATPISDYESVRDMDSYLKSNCKGITLNAVVSSIASADVRLLIETRLSKIEVTKIAYQKALLQRLNFQTTYKQYLMNHGAAAMIFPTTRLPARALNIDRTVDFMGKQVSADIAYGHNMIPAAITGAPGLSIPVGLTRSGLPVALELDGPIGGDRSVLALALSLERILPPTTIPTL